MVQGGDSAGGGGGGRRRRRGGEAGVEHGGVQHLGEVDAPNVGAVGLAVVHLRVDWFDLEGWVVSGSSSELYEWADNCVPGGRTRCCCRCCGGATRSASDPARGRPSRRPAPPPPRQGWSCWSPGERGPPRRPHQGSRRCWARTPRGPPQSDRAWAPCAGRWGRACRCAVSSCGTRARRRCGPGPVPAWSGTRSPCSRRCGAGV